MRNRRNRKSKNFIIISLIVVSFLMSVAYAVYSSDLNIGSAGKIIGDWDLRFSDATLNEATGNAFEVSPPVISIDGLTLSVAAALTHPSNTVLYDVDITNFSEMFSAEYKGIEIEYNEPEPFIRWRISGITEGDIIERDTTVTIALTAYWDYSKNDEAPKDTNEYSESATLTLKFEASRETGTITPEEDAPTPSIEYDITSWTNKDVLATISFDQDNITILNNGGNNEYTFTKNGSFKFDYGDSLGIRRSQMATVNWIDKSPPVITFAGNPKDNIWTNQNVTINPSVNENGSGFAKFLWNIDGGVWNEGWPGTFSDEITSTIGIIAVDVAGNKSEPVYTSLKINKTTPDLNLNGVSEMTIEVHGTYTEPGAKAFDQYGVDISSDINISGGVNPSVVGEYHINYEVVDAAGNKANKVRTINIVDTTLPVLTITPETMSLNQYGTFDLMDGVSAIDNYDKDITHKVTITPATSNWNVVNASTITREFTYKVTDVNGNISTGKRTITMIDKEAPSITINPSNVYVMEVNTPTDNRVKPEFKATASDNVDSSVSVVITDDININVVGTYPITFTATDATGNTKVETKTFTVRDTTAPVTTLSGLGTMTLEVHSPYIEPGYTAFDHYDKDVTENVVVTTNLNTSIVGSYWVRYNVKDAAENNATQRTRTISVVDTTLPVISIGYPEEKSYVVVEKGANYNLLDNVIATDNYDGNITNKIVRSHNSIDTTHLGMYYVTYNVTDVNGNKAIEQTKAIKVSTKPVITVTSPASMEVNTPTDPHTLPNFSATASDSLGSPLSVSITGVDLININVVGTYPVTYTATDVDGKTQTVVQNFQVKDTQSPIFAFLGETYIEVGLGEGYTETGWNVSDHYSQPNQINASIRVTNSSGTTIATINTTGDSIPNGSLIPSSHINTAGVYFLYYTVTEPAGNTQTYKREIVIYDSDLPSLTLMLSNVYSMEVNTLTDPHGIPSLLATANDKDGNPIPPANVVVTHNITPNIPGNYTVTFTATDTVNGKVRVQTMPFTVTHNRGPIITLNGAATVSIYASSVYNGPSNYTELGASAFDDYDGNVNVTISGNINPNVPGSYTVTYTAKDSANNTSTRNRTVIVTDNDAPIISFESDPLVINQNASVDVLSGVSAFDNVDGNITSKVMATPISISSSWPGYFTVNYNVRDNAGNTATTTRQIRIIDVTPPVITINSSNLYNMEVDTLSSPNTIPEFKATASDNVDGTISVSITHDIDPKKVGTYTVTFRATDAHLNVKTETKTFVVKDTTKPLLTINPGVVYVDQYGTFDLMSGVSAIDNCDGDITGNIIITPPSTDFNVVTSSTINRVFTYSITDANGNISTLQRTIIMSDKEKPVITINPSNLYTMEVNTDDDSHAKPTFNATASDNVDSSVNVVITDNININVVGTYTVTFTATDSYGNTSVETKSFIVQDTTSPVITLNDVEETIELHTLFNAMSGVSATDYYDKNITDDILVTGFVNSSVVGTYYIFYDVKDSSDNNAAQVMKTVHVINITPPILTINNEIVYVDQFTTFDLMNGVSAIDNYNIDITENIIVSPSTINYNVVGTHTIMYMVTDKDGNTIEKSRTIIINDKEAPIIAINPSNIYVMEVNTSSAPNTKPTFNATASDNVDLNVNVLITDDININVVGPYTVTFKATDSAGNSSTVTKEFIVEDTTPPVITLNGLPLYVFEVHGSYFEQGATAFDNYDGDITNKLVITGSVNPSEVGTYDVYYDVEDASGNTTRANRKIYIVDSTPPEINIDENNVYFMEVNTASDPQLKPTFNATASDNVDGDINVVVSDDININVVGTYTVTFKAMDGKNNIGTATREFVVEDTTPPVITLNGNEEITMEVYDSYIEPGATAFDHYDKNVTNDITITGSVNPSEVGIYYIYYNVKDTALNSATTLRRTIHIVDTTKPVFTVNPEVVYVNQFGSYNLMTGVNAIDNYDGDITGNVIVSPGTINFNVVSEHTITYRVTDANGNTEEKTRTIIINDKEAPIINIDPSNIYIMEVNTDDVSNSKPTFNATASDNVDGYINVVVNDDININVVGTYTVTFKATDTKGNVSSETRDFVVRDTTPPIITLKGGKTIALEAHETYIDLGATAWDYYDKDITSNIVVTGSINPSEVGTYYIYYNVKDVAGNIATTVTRTINVVDTTQPVITLNGNEEVTLEVHAPYTELGATAIDNYDGDITEDIVITGSVDTSTLGTYYINYNVKDVAGNIATNVTRTINIVDTTSPEITINLDNIFAMEVDTLSDSHLKPTFNASATDNYDSIINVVVSDEININVVGTYTVTFRATDSSGNVTTETEEFKVQDTTSPLIIEDSGNVYNMNSSSDPEDIPKFIATSQDYYDGQIDVDVSHNINHEIPGYYTVTFTSIDSSLNKSVINKTFTVY